MYYARIIDYKRVKSFIFVPADKKLKAMSQLQLEHKIGFDIIRERVKSRCSTDYARAKSEREEISKSAKEVEKRLNLVDELRVILMFESRFPQTGFTDCTVFLKTLQTPSSAISIENLRRLNSFMTELRQIKNFLEGTKPEQYPHLKAFAKDVIYFSEVAARINTVLDKNGDIKDNASEELAKICKGIRTASNSVQRRIESILKRAKEEGIADEDAAISVHDGKLLIPVAAHNKKGLSGIVQGESASGKTFFIEPLEVVELNNQLRELEFAKEREIARILFEFTEFLRPYLSDLKESAKFIGEVDFIMAKALCSKSYEGGMPIISKDKILKIKEGRHPVLESALSKENKKVVPLDLELDPQHRILIISGPNAGGKSVCLKTVGIIQYMLQWGILVPCSPASEFPILKSIFIDIGDEQSLENDLSTYSSHLLNMKNLLSEATEDSLVLIDEFGSGTEPAAGGAIAETILEELEAKGVYGVITTHYTNLKVYAENSKGVINGAMLFDSANIQPLYKLEVGIPGNSFAFDLARKIGLNEQIVRRAEEKAGNDFIDLERQLRKVSRNRRKLEATLTKIKFADKNLENVTERYSKELSEIQKTKKEIIESAKREAKQILEEANRRIEGTIKSIKESQAEKEKTKQARRRLKEFSATVLDSESSKKDEAIVKKIAQLEERKKRQRERKIQKPQEQKIEKPKELKLEVGAKVKVSGSELIGTVLKIDKTSLTIGVGEISSRVKIKDVTVISNAEFERSGRQNNNNSLRHNLLNVDDSITQRKLNFKNEIDLRGERLGDALGKVSSFIDDALMVNASKLRILHGKGTGVLREEIRKFLKTIPDVKDFYDEDVRFGGAGITVVELK